MQLSIQINESQLIAQCIAGEERSYKLLYQKHAKSVFHAVLRILGNVSDTEDIVQDAFVKAFEQIEQLRDKNNFEGWVKRIAINKAINSLRKRNVIFSDEAGLENIAEDEYNLEEEQLFQHQVVDVKNAIEKLPDGYKTIVSLYLFDEMSQDEIAKCLGISSATVRSQYHRAKKKIYSILKNKDYGK